MAWHDVTFIAQTSAPLPSLSFPNLIHLALLSCNIAPDIVESMLTARILPNLRVLSCYDFFARAGTDNDVARTEAQRYFPTLQNDFRAQLDTLELALDDLHLGSPHIQSSSVLLCLPFHDSLELAQLPLATSPHFIVYERGFVTEDEYSDLSVQLLVKVFNALRERLRQDATSVRSLAIFDTALPPRPLPHDIAEAHTELLRLCTLHKVELRSIGPCELSEFLLEWGKKRRLEREKED
jgi:hypothetical protein